MLNECGIPHTITGWSPTAYNRNDVIFTDGKFLQAFSDKDVLVMTLSYNSFKGKRFKGIGHTGIVDRVSKYSVRTIEGNTSGTLYSAGAFGTAKVTTAGDTVSVTYSTTATS